MQANRAFGFLAVLVLLHFVSAAIAAAHEDYRVQNEVDYTSYIADTESTSDELLVEPAGSDVQFSDCACDAGCGAWEAGVEMLVVRPHFGFDTNARIQIDPAQYDYEASPRLFLGYTGCSGFGVRTRYWHLDQDSEVLNLADQFFSAKLNTSVLFDVADLEMTFRGCCCNWDLLGSAGVRYAGLDYHRTGRFFNNLGDPQFASFAQNERLFSFDGYGPTLALEARRPLSCSLTPFVIARGSLLAGDYDVLSTDLYLPLIQNPNLPQLSVNRIELADLAQSLELQIGIEWSRCTSYGELFMAASLEGQCWNRLEGFWNDGDPFLADRESARSLMVLGGVVSVGFRR